MAKTYSVLGDSISTFEGAIPAGNRCYYDAADTNGTGVTLQDETWWARVIAAEDAELLANASFSGSMVQGDGFPAARDESRARQLLGGDGRAPDAVLVFIGINDYGWGSPEAQVVGGSEAAPKCVDAAAFPDVNPSGPAPADAVQRFECAYSEMLANVREVAPNAEIWCVTLLPGRMAGHAKGAFCYRLRGADLEEYNEAIRNAAEQAGARVADVAELGFDYDASDGTHPTKEGMVQLAALVRAAMCKARDDDGCAASLAGYPQRLRSARFCDKPSCIGCEHASITRDRWSCICADRLS